MIKIYSERRRYIAAILVTALTSILLAILEYYYVRVDSLPARTSTTPLLGPIYTYQAAVFIPLILITALTSILLAILEYYYVRVDSLPARTATTPLLGPIYTYQAAVFIPLILLAAFQPLIQDELLNIRVDKLRTTIPLGAASTLLGIVLLDSTWFILRALAPAGSDPLSGNWISAADYTAKAIGSTQILGTTIPIWYFASAPVIIAIYAALLMLPHED